MSQDVCWELCLWFIVNITVSETWADVVEWVYICSEISITLTYLLLCLDNCNKTIKTHCNDSSSIRMFGLSDEIWFAADERHSHSVDMMQWDAVRCREMQRDAGLDNCTNSASDMITMRTDSIKPTSSWDANTTSSSINWIFNGWNHHQENWGELRNLSVTGGLICVMCLIVLEIPTISPLPVTWLLVTANNNIYFRFDRF